MTQLLSPHLLDGTLGRAFALMAVAILAGLFLWKHCFSRPIPCLKRLIRAAIMIGLAGVALSLNSTFFQLSDPYDLDNAPLQWQLLAPLLFQTGYGRCWIIFSGLLLLTSWSATCKKGMFLNIAGLIACLAYNSHATESGLAALPFLLDMVHQFCMLLWMGGLACIILARYSAFWQARRSALVAFSNFILPVFLVGLATGGLRLLSAFLVESRLHPVYWSVAGIKAVLVLAVCLCAWRLRQLLRRELFNGRRYDDIVGMEFFFAVLLLFAAALLTQLPPR